MDKSQPSGILCPTCKTFIPITMMTLLNRDKNVCPCCELTIMFDKDAVMSAVKSLLQVQSDSLRVIG